MKKFILGSNLDLRRKGLSPLVLVLIMLVIILLLLVILDAVAGLRAKDGFIPFTGGFISQADYSPDIDMAPLAPLDIRIIWDILRDRNHDADLSLLDSDYARILAALETPVPSVTPRLSPTPTPNLSPTVSLSPSPSPTATPTATASIFPSQSPTASLTLTPTTNVYPSATRRPATSTPRPTITRTPTATATIHPLALLLDLDPSPGSINEPGGVVTYNLTLRNTVSYALTLISLVDSRFGNLNGLGTCVTGVVIGPGKAFACTYTGKVSGNGGDIISNQVTAVGRDSSNRTITTRHATAVNILDVLPIIATNFFPDTGTILEPGEVVTYSLTIVNASVELVELTGMLDDTFGNLDGTGDCETPQDISIGGTYSCRFSKYIAGNAGDNIHNTVTVTAVDDEANTAHDDASTSVSVTDVLPEIDLALDPEADTLVEPGGLMTYTLQVENLSVEPVSLLSLVDSQFGDLDEQGDCEVPQIIGVEGTYDCTFSGQVDGNAGDTFRTTVTASAVDDEDNITNVSADASISILDALPEIQLALEPDTTTLQAPGGVMTYTLQVENLSLETVTVDDLVDSQFGSLDGQGTCAVGVPVSGMSVFTCVYTGTILGSAGEIFTNLVTVRASDEEGNQTIEMVNATVTLVDDGLSSSRTASEGLLVGLQEDPYRLLIKILLDR